MKKIALGSLAIVAMAMTAASAADLRPAPVYKAAPMVDVFSWGGFYAGVNLGYSWGKSDTTQVLTNGGVTVATASNSFNMNGVVGGGQIGYNLQSSNWVYGIEADIQGTGQKGSTLYGCTTVNVCIPTAVVANGINATTVNLAQKLDWFGTVRGRLGTTVTPTTLLYVTGGLAYGSVSTDTTINGFTAVGPAASNAFSNSTLRAGWTIGAGLEARLMGNWTGKVEYLYVDLGTFSGATTTTAGTISPTLTSSYNSHITDNIVRVGLNYKLGGH